MQCVLVLCTLLAAAAVAVPTHKSWGGEAPRRIPEEDIKDDPWSGIDNDGDDDETMAHYLETGEPSLIPGEIPPYHADNPVKASKPQINFLSDYDDGDIDDYEPWRGPDFNPDDFPIYSSLSLPGEPGEPSLIPGEIPPYHQIPQTKPRIRGDQEIVDDDEDEYVYEDDFEDGEDAVF